MKLADVKPTLYYRASDDVEAAVHGAKLVWAKAGEEEETPDGGNSSDNGGTGSGGSGNTGGGDSGGSGDTGGGGDNVPGGDE